jgi:tyrosine decarboxylase
VDYKDWTPTLTLRFRTLKVGLVLRCYGVDGVRDHVCSHVRMAEASENKLKACYKYD